MPAKVRQTGSLTSETMPLPNVLTHMIDGSLLFPVGFVPPRKHVDGISTWPVQRTPCYATVERWHIACQSLQPDHGEILTIPRPRYYLILIIIAFPTTMY